jgi:glycerol kinase
MNVRGTVSGLTQGATAEHLIRAALESIAYQSKDVLDAMERDSGVRLKALNADGGATANDFLMQFQADILHCPVHRSAIRESTALGAAMLAGLACGLWTEDRLRAFGRHAQCFEPAMPEVRRKTLYAGWQRAVRKARCGS